MLRDLRPRLREVQIDLGIFRSYGLCKRLKRPGIDCSVISADVVLPELSRVVVVNRQYAVPAVAVEYSPKVLNQTA